MAAELQLQRLTLAIRLERATGLGQQETHRSTGIKALLEREMWPYNCKQPNTERRKQHWGATAHLCSILLLGQATLWARLGYAGRNVSMEKPQALLGLKTLKQPTKHGESKVPGRQADG